MMELLKRGLEPDESDYIQNEPVVRRRNELELGTDPFPDLAIEVEVSRGVLDRLGIYAALGVSELWTFDGKNLRVCGLRRDGAFHNIDHSLNLPMLPIAEVARFLNDRTRVDETTLIRSFRDWVRANLISESDCLAGSLSHRAWVAGLGIILIVQKLGFDSRKPCEISK